LEELLNRPKDHNDKDSIQLNIDINRNVRSTKQRLYIFLISLNRNFEF